MSYGIPAMVCSTAEAVYLAALLGANNLVGFADPFYGWLAEEVKPALAEVRDRLAVRGVLELHADGSATLHEPAATLIAGCVRAGASLMLTRAAHGETDALNFHVAPDLVVIQRPAPGAQTHELAGMGDQAELMGHLLDFLALEGHWAAPAPGSVELPEQAFREARALAAEVGEGAACDLLVRAGVSAAAAAVVARSLTEPAWMGTLVGVDRSAPDWAVEGAAFLGGAGGLWQVRTTAHGGAEWVQLSPCDGEQAAAEISRVVGRLLPTEVAR